MSESGNHITAKIDGKVIHARKGLTILEAARKSGIYIPTLCYLENLESYGGCRLCIVEVKNMKGLPTSCTTPLEDGMDIKTKTPQLQKLRAEILELSLSEHPYTCLVCKDKKECTDYMHTTRKVSTITGCNFCSSSGDCELQDLVDYLEIKDVKYPITYRGIPPVKDNPFYDLDYNLCILCGRCVRICNEERNSNVLAFIQRGNSTIIGTAFNEPQKDAGCEFCGACVDVCPTGSISEKIGKWTGLPDRSTETYCAFCPLACRMNVNTRGDRIINVGAKPGGRTNPPQLCLRAKFLAADMNHHPDRITVPKIRRKGKWTEVSWKEAIEFTSSNLERYRGNQFGVICSAQDTIEENYILQKFSRKVMRSNNIDLMASYPDRNLLKDIHGYYSEYPPAGLADIEKADTLLVLASDASVSHPLLENRIRKAFNRGKEVMYAGAYRTRTSNFARQEINYTPGQDHNFLYLLLSELAGTITSGNQDTIRKQFKKEDILRASKLCGVKADVIKPFVKNLSASRNLLIVAGDDLMRHPSAREIFHMLMNIHLLKSGKQKCRIMLPGYEGNLYAGSLIGVHPDYLPGFMALEDETAIGKWNHNWETVLSSIRGLSCKEMTDNIRDDCITALMVAGNMPVTPKLAGLKFLVQFNMFETALSQHASVLFPVTSFLENDGHIINMEGRLLELGGVVAGPEKVRTIPQIIADLAGTMQESGFTSIKPENIFEEIDSFTGICRKVKGKKTMKYHPITMKPEKPDKNKTDKTISDYYHYSYRGNRLSDLIPDLQHIINEGTEKA